MRFNSSVSLTALLICALLTSAVSLAFAQANTGRQADELARAGRAPNGDANERGEFQPGNPDIRITLNVPSFRLILWQSGREVASYYVGVGKRDHPIVLGQRQASEIIWNPNWIPPNSPWVRGMRSVRPGEVIRASDPRNPLGKIKIPLGDAYLIHEAAGVSDLGNLVSHGCIRMLRRDLYDLTEKIVAARSLDVTPQQIARAQSGSRMLVARMEAPLPVEISYDTQIVADGALHLYPDVYQRGTNTIARLRAKLAEHGVDSARLDDRTLRQLLARVGRRTVFVVPLESINAGRALTDGRPRPLIARAAAPRPAASGRRATR